MDDMDHNSYHRIRPYSSRHSRRLISQNVQSLDNRFGDISPNTYDVNSIDSIPTVTEPMEDDLQSCYSDLEGDENYDSDCLLKTKDSFSIGSICFMNSLKKHMSECKGRTSVHFS